MRAERTACRNVRQCNLDSREAQRMASPPVNISESVEVERGIARRLFGICNARDRIYKFHVGFLARNKKNTWLRNTSRLRAGITTGEATGDYVAETCDNTTAASLKRRAGKILLINIVLQNVTSVRKVAFTEEQVRRGVIHGRRRSVAKICMKFASPVSPFIEAQNSIQNSNASLDVAVRSYSCLNDRGNGSGETKKRSFSLVFVYFQFIFIILS